MDNLIADECLEGNCINGKGHLKKSNGAIYRGDFKDSMFHGQGVYFFKDGQIYSGEFENGIIHGEGAIISPNGEKQRFIFKKGKKFEYIFENEIEKQNFLKKISKKNKIRNNAKFRCNNKKDEYFFLTFDKKYNEIAIRFDEAFKKELGFDLDSTLDKILFNNDDSILVIGIKTIPFSVIEKNIETRDNISEEIRSKGFQLILRLYIDKYSAQATLSMKSTIDKDHVNWGFGIMEEMIGEDYYNRDIFTEELKCIKKILN